jgi:hypothetical protein
VPLLVVGGWFVEALVACQLSMVGCWFGIAGRCWWNIGCDISIAIEKGSACFAKNMLCWF